MPENLLAPDAETRAYEIRMRAARKAVALSKLIPKATVQSVAISELI